VKTLSRIGASLSGGRTRLDIIRSCAPIHLRETPDGVYMVGGAAGPLGGDDLVLEIDVEPGATLVVRSAAASIALPDHAGRPSTVTVNARVGSGATLHWLPEPVIAGAGCNHRIFNRVTLEAGASVVWRDELVLGRRGEASGAIRSQTDVTVGGRPLLRNALSMGGEEPGWDGPAGVGTAGAVGSLLVSFPQMVEKRATALGPEAWILPLAGPGVLVPALADDSLEVRMLLNRASRLLNLPFV
jgi:urease accessory protein